MERGDRGCGVALPGGAVETVHRLPLLLAQQRGELGEGRHPAVAGQPRGDCQHEHRAQAVALAPRMAVLGHGAEKLEQRAQLRRVGRCLEGCALPGRILVRLAQGAGGVGLQFVHENLLGPAVTAPPRGGARLARIAAGEAQRAPVGGPVAGAGKECRVHERLGQQERPAVLDEHVVREPPQAQAEHSRGQVAGVPARQNHEAGILDDEVQTAQLLLPGPADPAVPGPEPERGGLPAEQRNPGLPQHGDMAQSLAEQPVERQIVVPRHQAVPSAVFPGPPRRTHPHGAQIQIAEAARRRLHVPKLTDPEQNVHPWAQEPAETADRCGNCAGAGLSSTTA